MNTTFSFKRILHLLHADWIEYDTYILFYSIAMLAALTVFMIYNTGIAVFLFLLMCVAVGYCRFAGDKVHRSTGMFLTLPASTPEKFVTLLLEGLLFFVAYGILFGLAYLIVSLFVDHQVFYYYESYPELYSFCSFPQVSLWLFLFTLLFFFNVAVRKYAIIFFAIVSVVFLFASSQYAKSMFERGLVSDIPHSLSDLPLWVIEALYALSGLLLYLSYVQFKRKQLR